MEQPVSLVSRPQLRCYGQALDRHRPICAKPAVWMLLSPHGLEAEFFCDVHRRDGCLPIALDAPFRRIQMGAEVLMAATSLLPKTAMLEARAELERAILGIGGTVTVSSGLSVVGRLTMPAGAWEARTGKGSRR